MEFYKKLLTLNRFSYKKTLQIVVLFIGLLYSFHVQGQLTVTTPVSNAVLQASLFGPGLTISNLAVNGTASQYGTFVENGGLGLNSGVILTNGNAIGAIGPNDSNTIASTCVGTSSSDACIQSLTTGTQHDPCIITFTIIPNCDTLTMQYVFGSEEYPDFVGSFDDVFGFFINGPKPGGGTYSCSNVALLPGTTTPVSINTVNANTNSSYYINNALPSAPGHATIYYNGLTVPLTAVIPVVACQSYTMEIAIADIGDCNYDSGVFLQFQGMKCAADQTLAVTPKDTTVCLNQPVVLSAKGGSGGYTWSPATGLSATTGASVTANVTATTQYIVSSASACGTVTDTATITIGGKSVMKTTTSSVGVSTCAACNGSASIATVTGGSGGPYSYSWNTGATTSSVSNVCSGSYTVIVHDDGASCPAPNDTDIISVVSASTPPLVVNTISAGGCTACSGSGSVTSASGGSGGPYTYTWLPGNMTTQAVTGLCTGTYSVIVHDNGTSCTAANDTSVITINTTTSSAIAANSTSANTGCKPCSSTASLTAVAGGSGGPYTYTWLPGNMTTQSVTNLCNGTYSVVIQDNGTSCIAPNDTVTIKINIPPQPTVLFSADSLNGCSPLCVNFTDGTTIPAGSIKSWSWNFGDDSTATIQNPRHCFTASGVFSVELTVTSDSGCIANLTVPQMISSYSHPSPAFNASPQPATILNPLIYFKDESKDAYGISSWFWQFEDPTDATSSIKNPQFTYSDTGTYCPKLTVVNLHGCIDSTQECLVINPLYTIYIPNAFSPNNDGINDVFSVKATYVCGFHMYIFDRWGTPIYSTSDITKGWDGKAGSSGKVAQEDTYVYLVEATDCVDHQNYQYIGKVSLVK
ncbi:MAG TPA: choice-of-anchor L domain-containing protein [Bacteroidia bacterium]|nr:choice-of-anchor L domain-containing protein [Bacteroidia bacterium]